MAALFRSPVAPQKHPRIGASPTRGTSNPGTLDLGITSQSPLTGNDFGPDDWEEITRSVKTSKIPLSGNDFGGNSLKPRTEPPPIASPAYRAAASFNPTKTGQAASKRVSNLEPRKFLFVGAGVALLVAVAGLLMPLFGLLLCGAILFLTALPGLVGGIWILILAFEEDILCGLLFLFLPFYALYYVVDRWENELPFWLFGGAFATQIAVIAYQALLFAIW